MAKGADTTIALKKMRKPDDGLDETTGAAPKSTSDQDTTSEQSAASQDGPKTQAAKGTTSGKGAKNNKKESSKPIQQVWHSGDFRKTPRSLPPYNGLKITADYTLGATGQFEFVKVTFTDHTNVKSGLSSTIDKLFTGDDWTPVPKPESSKPTKDSQPDTAKGTPPADPSKPSDFTVKGHVKISSEPNGKFLRLRLKSGLPPGFQQLGFIMRLTPPPSTS